MINAEYQYFNIHIKSFQFRELSINFSIIYNAGMVHDIKLYVHIKRD
jgi:hypothetical protein